MLSKQYASEERANQECLLKILSSVRFLAHQWLLFTHCYGHVLNLSVGNTLKQCKVMRSALDTVYKISKLLKKSPKRNASFQKPKQELAPDTPYVLLCDLPNKMDSTCSIVAECAGQL